jgi:D-aspartate ligase
MADTPDVGTREYDDVAHAGRESRRSTPLPVVILSGGVTGLGVLRAFARRGVPAYVVPVAKDDPLRYSRWFRELPGIHLCAPQQTPTVEWLEGVLARSGLERVFLCPCSDDWNRVVARLAECGQGRFFSVVPPAAALEVLQNKAQLALMLQRLGVPMPATRLVGGPEDLADLPRTDETFYFLKPTDSQSFLRRFGTKGLRVRTAEEARRRLDEVLAAGMSVVLQEYIPGSFAEHYFVDGYADRDGVIKALFPRRRLRIYPPDFGNSTSMVSVPLAEVPGAIDTLRRVLAEVHYRGIFSAEFKRDPRDGLFKLLEINARPWWFVDFAVRSGVDVCSMAYDDARGLEVAPVESYQVGSRCIYPYYDFFAMQPLLASGAMSVRRWFAEFLRARQPIACWDDPLPGLVGASRVLGAAVRRRLTGRHA